MSVPVGGRGKKSPYKTTHVRVPEPMKSEIERLIKNFHQDYNAEPENMLTSLSDAIAIAQGILTQKKSARVSIEKLLTALYNTKVELK